MIARLGSAAVLLFSMTFTAIAADGTEKSYEERLLRLSEILGAIHHLRDICGANEGQLWREQMVALLEAEDPPSQYRARLIAAFNNSYRGFQRTYGTCTTSAKQAINRFFTEGSQIAASLAITLETRPDDQTAETGTSGIGDAGGAAAGEPSAPAQ